LKEAFLKAAKLLQDQMGRMPAQEIKRAQIPVDQMPNLSDAAQGEIDVGGVEGLYKERAPIVSRVPFNPEAPNTYRSLGQQPPKGVSPDMPIGVESDETLEQAFDRTIGRKPQSVEMPPIDIVGEAKEQMRSEVPQEMSLADLEKELYGETPKIEGAPIEIEGQAKPSEKSKGEKFFDGFTADDGDRRKQNEAATDATFQQLTNPSAIMASMQKTDPAQSEQMKALMERARKVIPTARRAQRRF
jgi:hypothetical protein